MSLNTTATRSGAVGYPEAAEYLGVGLTTFKRLVRDGSVRAIHVYRRAVVPITELDRYLDRRLNEQAGR